MHMSYCIFSPFYLQVHVRRVDSNPILRVTNVNVRTETSLQRPKPPPNAQKTVDYYFETLEKSVFPFDHGEGDANHRRRENCSEPNRR
jgi:hypothetical protein